jgi:hypothetical protein
VGTDGYNSAGDSMIDMYKHQKRMHSRSEDNRPDREWRKFVSSFLSLGFLFFDELKGVFAKKRFYNPDAYNPSHSNISFVVSSISSK